MLAWSNLGAALSSNLAQLTLIRNGVFLDYWTAVFYSAVSFIILMVAANTFFTRVGPKVVQEMSEVSRLILIIHILFLIIFLATCVPYSIALVRILFASDPILYFATPSTFYMIAFPLALQLVMYGYEGALRSVVRVNTFLVVHHVAFCAFVLLALQSRSVFVGKAGIILSCFATYEWPPFVALIARRLKAPRWFSTYAMAVSMAFVVLTRLVQAALLIGLYVAGYGYQSRTSRGAGLWWSSMVLSIFVVVLQTYLLVIYLTIMRRTKKSRSSAAADPVLPRHSPLAIAVKKHDQPNAFMLSQIADVLMTTHSLNGLDTASITTEGDIFASSADLLPLENGHSLSQHHWKPSSSSNSPAKFK